MLILDGVLDFLLDAVEVDFEETWVVVVALLNEVKADVVALVVEMTDVVIEDLEKLPALVVVDLLEVTTVILVELVETVADEVIVPEMLIDVD